MALIQGLVDTQKQNLKSLGVVNAGDSLEIQLEVKERGGDIEFVNPIFELLAIKSDGTRVRQLVNIRYVGNIVIIEGDEQLVSCPGVVSLQLIINDNKRMSTCLFYFMCGKSFDRDIIQSIDKVGVLQELDSYVITMFSNLKEFEERIIEVDKTIRKLSEDMNEAEKVRGAAETKRQETFQAKQEEREKEYQESKLDKDNDYNLAEKNRDNLYKDAESSRNQLYLNEKSDRNNKFEQEKDDRKLEFNTLKAKMEEATNNSKNEENRRALTFTDLREAMEHLKSTMIENNNVMVNNESGRVAAETKRVADFNKMKEDNTTLGNNLTQKVDNKIIEIEKINEDFKKNISAQYEDIVTEFDKVIANVTNGNENATNSEIVQARGKEVNLNARLDNFDEQLDNKAKQSDLIVERKRIDNLTTLPEGSTMGDAELMDGRIGLGGKIFNNIGDAIRSQFGYINEKSNDLTFNYISGNNETSNLINYVSYYKKGYYVHSNGTENSNSDFAISELIPVTPLATCRFKILSDDATSVQHTGVILDKNGQYIQPLTKLDSITDITEKEIILPSNAYFVRVNLRIGFNKSYFKIVGTKELKWLRICKENLKDDVFFEKNLPWNGKKVTIYGDSLAQINDWAGNTLSWVSFLKEYCGFSEVVNKGIGGTTITPGTREGKTNDFYTRITTQNDIGTHLFIIFGGMNDYLFNSVIGSPNEAPGNTTLCNSVKSICEHIQTRYPESQILFILPPYGVPEPTTTNTIKEVSKAIEESVEDYGVEILNLTKYGDITVKNSAQKSLYYYDGIHYNDKGHERIAKNKIIPKVNSMLIRN